MCQHGGSRNKYVLVKLRDKDINVLIHKVNHYDGICINVAHIILITETTS